MTIEQQVVSLELAKKMKELGFEQESLWYWCIEPKSFKNRGWYLARTNDRKYSAYTVAELISMLPAIVCSNKHGDGELFIEKFDNGERVSYSVSYRRIDNKSLTIQGRKKNLIPTQTAANAMAKMLIYLKENNLLED